MVNTDFDPSIRSWDDRQQRMGCTCRAVLFKRFPNWLNASVHRRHIAFIRRNLPTSPRQVLDVGCGYGRISMALRKSHPEIEFEGVEACNAFADHFEQHIGKCHRCPAQDFQPHHGYDVILMVTILMYLSHSQQQEIFRRLWTALLPNGRIICIEPAVEFLRVYNVLTGKRIGTPPASGAYHFSKRELGDRLGSHHGARVVDSASIRLLPGIPMTAIHHCVAVEKAVASCRHDDMGDERQGVIS